MKLTIAKCPACGENMSGTVDFIQGIAQATVTKKVFEYDGETEVDWDSQKNVLDVALRIFGRVENSDDFMLVSCENGHAWITSISR